MICDIINSTPSIPPEELYLAEDWREIAWPLGLSEDPATQTQELADRKKMFYKLQDKCMQAQLQGLSRTKERPIVYISRENPYEHLPELPR